MKALETHLSHIAKILNDLCQLIADEHSALEQGDLEQIEQIAATKVEYSRKLDQNYQAIRLLIQDDSIRTLSEYIAKTPREKLGRLIDLYEVLMDAKERYSKILDINRRVLSKVLAARQSNYQFWQNLISETGAPYDQSGRKKSLKTGSSLQLKA